MWAPYPPTMIVQEREREREHRDRHIPMCISLARSCGCGQNLKPHGSRGGQYNTTRTEGSACTPACYCEPHHSTFGLGLGGGWWGRKGQVPLACRLMQRKTDIQGSLIVSCIHTTAIFVCVTKTCMSVMVCAFFNCH